MPNAFRTFAGVALLALSAANAAPNYCQLLRAGTAPAPSPNTPSSFHDFSFYEKTAMAAQHPPNYEPIMVAKHAALQDDSSYMTYEEMEEYDVKGCAKKCEDVGCASCKYFLLSSPSPINTRRTQGGKR